MLSNVLEFRDDAGNEIAFFEKKKKTKCGQSVAMVNNLQFYFLDDLESQNPDNERRQRYFYKNTQ